MLESYKYEEYLSKHKIPMRGIQYIYLVRNSNAPGRKVGVYAKKNVSGSYFSNKMGFTISVESNVELRYAINAEYSDSTFEYWDQPDSINIIRTNKNGVQRNSNYTADFLILTNSGPEIIEVKTENELTLLVQEKKVDWKLENNIYHFLPAESKFEELGLKLRVVSDKDLPKVRTENLKILLQSRKYNEEDEADKEKIITDICSDYFSISMYELKKIANLNNYSKIIQLIDQQKLFFDIDNYLLSNPKSTYITSSRELLEIIKSEKLKSDILIKDKSENTEAFLIPSAKDAVEALNKLNRIKKGENNRSIRRWKSLIEEGNKKGLSEFQSLIPKHYKKGNRNKKINNTVREFIEESIKTTYSSSKRLSIYKGYVSYRVEAKERHPDFPPVSRKTFTRYLISMNQEEIAYRRGGKRAANAAADSSAVSDRSLKSQLAFENASVDHYLSDIYIVCFSSTEVIYVQRPWLSAMVDEATNAILAVTMLFSPPSIKSCALLIRECVRHHGRLPESILVDRGSDFRSVYFSSLLAHYGVDLQFRPSSYPQYGSEVESLFAEFKKDWLPHKEGNITQYREARAVDGKKSPRETAIHDPFHFYKELQLFCNWRDDTKIIGIHNETTAKKLNSHKKSYPFIGNSVSYNQELLLATATDCKKYKVDYQRGIHVDGRHYWHTNIQKIRGKKTKLEVRIEPENPNQIYALIENKWVTCQSTGDQTFHTLDPVQRHIQSILARDTFQLRRFAKTEADEDLIRLIKHHESKDDRTLESKINQDNYSNPIDEDLSSENSLFEQIRRKKINDLERKKWAK